MPAFPTTPLLDNFDRSNEGPIGGNWSTPVTQVGFGAQAALSSNGIISQNTPPATVSAYWDIETFLNSEAWIECDADLEATESFVVYARLKDVGTVNWDGYQVALVFDGSFTIARRDNAVSTLLASTTVTASVGDYIGIRCVGSVIQAWHRPVGTGVWVHVLSATDSTYPDAGYIGFGMFTTDLTTKLDNFGGGTYSPYAAQVLADNPVAYYRMNEVSGQPQDSSGNANHTTAVSGTPTYGHPTPIPGGAGIWLQDDYFTAPDHSTLDLGDVWTLECWVSPARYCGVGESFGLISKGGDGSYYFRLEYDTATSYALDSLSVNTANLIYADTTDLHAREWHHLVATKNGSTRLIYIDGQDCTAIGSGTNSTTTNNTDTLFIGAMNVAAGVEIADAIFSEVAVYPTALSPARVLAHYNAASAYAMEVLADEPVVYYRMHELSGQLHDSSGNGIDTTVVNGTPNYTQTGALATDPTNDAILFDSSATEYFTAPHNSALDVGDSFTLEAWIKRGTLASGEYAIITKGRDGTGSGPGLYIYTDDRIMIGYVGITGIAFSSETITDTDWHHVVGTKNGPTMRIYLDGVDVSDPGSDFNNTIDNSDNVLGIGVENSFGSFGSPFDGILDEVAMYDTALSPARILAHYAAGVGGYVAEVLADEPVAYYRMNEAEFSVIASDNFNRANEDPLAGDWTTAVGDGGAMRIVSNVATKNATVDANNDGAIYDGITFPDNQYSAAKLSVTSTNGVRRGPALFVRHAFSANTSYRISVDHAASNNCNISRFLAGVRTTLLDFTQAWTDGAEWKIAVDGPASAARIRIYLNGTLLQTVTDNSSIASGYPGIGVSDQTDVSNVVIDDWYAGEVLLIQDSSGLAHHATTSGGTAIYEIPSPNPIETDPNNYFIDFNGTLSYGIPDHTDLDFGDVMTAEAWVISGDWQHGPTHHVISGRGSGALTWYVDYTDNKLTVAKADTGNICKADFVFEEDVWYHCMYTKNGSTSRIYINGVNVTGTVTNQTLVDVSNQLVVGGDYDLTSYRFYGALDEVAFYRTALSRDRAIAHYLAAGGFLLNSFETGLPTSTAITTANSNDDVAGAQWDNLVVTAGGSAVYTTDKSAYGTRSGLFTPVAAGGAHVRWDDSSLGTALDEVWGRFYIYRSANPTPNHQWMTHLGVTGTGNVGVIRWTTAGKLEILDGDFNTAETSTNSIPLEQWVRVEFYVDCHSTFGTLEAKFFNRHETSPIETVTANNINTAQVVDELNFGQWNAETTGGSFYLDEVALSTTEYIGPATLVVEPQTVFFVRRRSWR